MRHKRDSQLKLYGEVRSALTMGAAAKTAALLLTSRHTIQRVVAEYDPHGAVCLQLRFCLLNP